jgi:hypothetical protein
MWGKKEKEKKVSDNKLRDTGLGDLPPGQAGSKQLLSIRSFETRPATSRLLTLVHA